MKKNNLHGTPPHVQRPSVRGQYGAERCWGGATAPEGPGVPDKRILLDVAGSALFRSARRREANERSEGAEGRGGEGAPVGL